MVWPITGAESYVCEAGKSMKAMVEAVKLAVGQGDCWRNVAIAFIERVVLSHQISAIAGIIGPS